MKRSATAKSSAGSDRFEVATIEKIETTTTVEVFQFPELRTPRCWSDQFRWTGLPLEREDDMVSTAPDAVSVSSSAEELNPTTGDEVVTVTVGDSSDDMDIDSDLDERRSVELVRTNLQVAPRRELEVATIATSCTVQESIWIEGSNDEPPQQVTWQIDEVELDTVDKYRNFFIMWNHYNLIGHDRQLGPVLLSFTTEVEADSNEKLFRVLLWLPMGTLHKLIPMASVGLNPSPIKLAKALYNRLDVIQFKPVVSLEASTLIADFEKDFHAASNYLFGIIRNSPTPALKEFLEFFGQLVQLRDRTLVFTVFKDKDIEFRVTSCDDPSQQLVAILFQDNSEYPVTNPMHALIVVQPLAASPPNCRYRVTVGDDAPKVFAKAPELREFILTKLINAENALKSETIRAPLLGKLVKQLEQQTREFLGEDRDGGEKSTEINTWKHAQLQRYLDDHRELKQWAQLIKVQIGTRGQADEALQERIAQKFSALEQSGLELLRINSQVSLEIQSQIEPVQEQLSRCKRELLEQIAGSPVPTPVAPPVEKVLAVQVVERVKKKKEESKESSPNEALVYRRLVATIEDEGKWINQKETWLKALVAEDYLACCFEEKYDEFMKEFVAHWDNFQTMCVEGGKLSNGKFSETIDQLCTLLGTGFENLQKLATKSLAHAPTTELGNSSVATTDSGFLSVTETSLAQVQSPLAIFNSLAKSIRVDRKTLWTTCVGMRRAWQHNGVPVMSEVTLAQIVEIVGFFLDYVASLLREDSPEDDPEKITKKLLLKRISGQLFRFFREDRQRGGRDLETIIKKRAIKERFLRTFSRKTKIANEAANLLQLLTLDFVMYLRNNIRRLLDGSHEIQFEHIDKALCGVGFGFLVRPEESGV